MSSRKTEPTVDALVAAGLRSEEVGSWRDETPGPATTDFAADQARLSRFWTGSARLLARLPRSAQRTDEERSAADLLHDCARRARVEFLRRHADAVYDALTAGRSRFVRLEELVLQAAAVVPGLVPTKQEIAAEDNCLQRDKSGLEIDQGLFLSAILGSQIGRASCRERV